MFAERRENQHIRISPQLTLATFQYLSTSECFSFNIFFFAFWWIQKNNFSVASYNQSSVFYLRSLTKDFFIQIFRWTFHNSIKQNVFPSSRCRSLQVWYDFRNHTSPDAEARHHLPHQEEQGLEERSSDGHLPARKGCGLFCSYFRRTGRSYGWKRRTHVRKRTLHVFWNASPHP